MKTQNKALKKDLNSYVSADLGYTTGNGEHWQSRWQNDSEMLYIDFAEKWGEIHAFLNKSVEIEDGEFEYSIVDSENLGDWNADDFAYKAFAFASKCGF